MSQAIVHCNGKVKRVWDLKYSDNGTPYMSFSFVQTAGYGDNVHFDWFRATVFGKQAEGLAGKLIPDETRFSLCGRMKVSQYDRPDGTQGVEVQVSVMDFQFAGEKPRGDGEERPSRPAGRPQGKKPAGKPQPKEEYESDGGDGEDELGY